MVASSTRATGLSPGCGGRSAAGRRAQATSATAPAAAHAIRHDLAFLTPLSMRNPMTPAQISAGALVAKSDRVKLAAPNGLGPSRVRRARRVDTMLLPP
jgi:hypothetical protein